MSKFLVTQSLLSAWNWSFKLDDGHESFLKTLNREPFQPTKAMLDGIRFENLVNAYACNNGIDQNHEWAQPIKIIGEELRGSALQVKLSKNIAIDGMNFVLYGILDAVKAGTIYDIKFSQSWKHGKYLDSPQHPMYLEICPCADRFIYIVSDGESVFKETYCRDESPSIKHEINQFMHYLDGNELMDIYRKKWLSRY